MCLCVCTMQHWLFFVDGRYFLYLHIIINVIINTCYDLIDLLTFTFSVEVIKIHSEANILLIRILSFKRIILTFFNE